MGEGGEDAGKAKQKLLSLQAVYALKSESMTSVLTITFCV
jgi:hypothetical protein